MLYNKIIGHGVTAEGYSDWLAPALHLDLYSFRRLTFNVFIYANYSLILVLSFGLAALLTSSAGIVESYSPQTAAYTVLLVIITKFFVYNFFNFKRFTLYSMTFYDAGKTLFLIIAANTFLYIGGAVFHVEYLAQMPYAFWIMDASLNYLFILGFHMLLAYHRSGYSKPSGLPLVRRDGYRGNGDSKQNPDHTSAVIVGAGDTGQALCDALTKSDHSIQVRGFIDDDPHKIGMSYGGKKIYGPLDDIAAIVRKLNAGKIIIAIPSSPARMKQVFELIGDMKVSVATVPSYFDIISGSVKVDQIREIRIEDLLSRDAVHINLDRLSETIGGKTVLVTGAAGSIGSVICDYVLRFRPARFIALDQAETPMFYLEKKLRLADSGSEIVPIVADITNERRMRQVFNRYRPDIILHAAAYKHVPMMEVNVQEAVLNNVLGTKNLADCAHDSGADRFVMISTDKAVNPTSIMGLTKRLAEMYIQSFNGSSQTGFITVRFGNVLDSEGNVTQIFKNQIRNGGPVTVTHPDMRRYFMSTSEAVQLVLEAGTIGGGGELFLLDMGEPVAISELARSMIRLSGLEIGKDIQIAYTGIRAGEKLYEELNYSDEILLETSHPKIFMCRGRALNPDDAKRGIEQLIQNLQNLPDLDANLDIITCLVPEYRNDREVQNDDAICSEMEIFGTAG